MDQREHLNRKLRFWITLGSTAFVSLPTLLITDLELSRFATGSDSRTLSCLAERDGNHGDKPSYTQFQSAVCIV